MYNVSCIFSKYTCKCYLQVVRGLPNPYHNIKSIGMAYGSSCGSKFQVLPIPGFKGIVTIILSEVIKKHGIKYSVVMNKESL